MNGHPPNVNTNVQTMTLIRTTADITTGAAAGLLGLTGLQGVLLYLTIPLTVGITLLLKTAFHPSHYLKPPLHSQLLQTTLSRNSLLTYLLFWTLLFPFR